MKKITKTKPDFFATFLEENKPQEWKDISPIREQIRLHILKIEQNYQCAYTGISLKGNNDDSHIDHYKKQNMFPEERFNYNNMFVSTNNEKFGAKYKDKHITEAEYNLLINPVLEDPNEYFEYYSSGEIYSKNNSEKGKKTIELLQLNHRFLTKRRKDKIKIFNSYKNMYNIEELIEYIKEFEGMIRNLYNNI